MSIKRSLIGHGHRLFPILNRHKRPFGERPEAHSFICDDDDDARTTTHKWGTSNFIEIHHLICIKAKMHSTSPFASLYIRTENLNNYAAVEEKEKTLCNCREIHFWVQKLYLWIMRSLFSVPTAAAAKWSKSFVFSWVDFFLTSLCYFRSI